MRCCKATYRVVFLTRRGPRWLDPAQLRKVYGNGLVITMNAECAVKEMSDD